MKKVKSQSEKFNLFSEALADIAYYAGEAGYYSGDSRADMQEFISLAWEFEKLHENTEWDEQGAPDFIISVNEFAVEKLKLKKKWKFYSPENAAEAWDVIEVNPCLFLDDGNATECEEDEAEFYSVTIHLLRGGRETIADLPTKERAEQLAGLIEAVSKTRQNNKLMFTPLSANIKWSDLEISPVRDDGKGIEKCRDRDAQFYSVYLHSIKSMPPVFPQCVANLPTKKDAQELAQLIDIASTTKIRP